MFHLGVIELSVDHNRLVWSCLPLALGSALVVGTMVAPVWITRCGRMCVDVRDCIG